MNPIVNLVSPLIRENFDIIHVHSYAFIVSNVVALLKRFKDLHYVLQFHGGIQYYWKGINPLKLLIKEAIYDPYIGAYTVTRADKVLSVSKSDIPLIRKKFGVDAYKLLDKQAEKVPIGSRGLIFLPYLLGERSPISDPKARGAFIGISLSNKREDFFRAMLEGISFTLRHNLETYREMNMAPIDLRMCGGGAKSSLWREIIVNVLGMECKLLENPGETTAMGIAACILAGVKIYDSIEKAVENFVKIKGIEKPVFEENEKYDKLFKIYLKCYPALREIMHALYDISRK